MSIATGDLNNDHYLDIVITNNGTSNIGIFFGYGDGLFENQITYSTGYDSLPSYVLVNDFNHDHHLDILVANYGTDSIGLFLGCGDGSFTSQITYSTIPQSRPYSLATNDIKNDGHLYIVVANSGTNSIAIFFGDGNTSFVSHIIYSISPGSRPQSIVIGDFNGDSQLDIAVANSGTNNIGILLNYGNKLFSNVTIYSTGDDSQPMSLAIDDFNNDSRTDIAVANSGSNNIAVLVRDGNGKFSILTAYPMDEDSKPLSVTVVDYNRDHQLDIAVTNYGANNVCVLFSNGNGTFTNQTCYSLGYDAQPTCIIFKDLNNDGWDDIIVTTSGTDNIKILLNLCHN